MGVKLGEGEVVDSRWRVVRLLAEGGFGAVYEVADENTKRYYAMKVEPTDQNSVMKIELAVLLKLRGASAHSCDVVGWGRTTTRISYLVMTLIGPSLCDLHRSRPNRTFSGATAARLGIQCITALQDLHRSGFVHRDVKPGNFAIGRTVNDKRLVYLLDFGLARRFKNIKGLRPMRSSAGFRGTVRYASINVHAGAEQGRHDDLWSLLYSLGEFRLGRLPWHNTEDDDDVAKEKRKAQPSEIFADAEGEYVEMHERLRQLTYKDKPDYEWFMGRFSSMQKRLSYAQSGPFEWEECQDEM